MRLLILTQKVDKNDDLLAFFHDWLKEFSKYSEKISVVCLNKGDYNLPDNVRVYSLGKESISQEPKAHKVKSKLLYTINFYKYIWRLRKEYDAVFVHMNTEYILLGGFFWRLLNKKIILWYTHRKVNLKLRISERITNLILTASADSFQLKSKKIKVLGHGIDIDKFKKVEMPKDNEKNGKFNIIYVGRISRIKNQKLLVKAIDILVNKKNIRNINVKLFGRTITNDDKKYFLELNDLINKLSLKEYIKHIDNIFYNEIVNAYNEANVNINLCPRGGLDKAVIEAMACELPVLVANTTYRKDIEIYADSLLVGENDCVDLANKIEALIKKDQEELNKIGKYLRNKAVSRHNSRVLLQQIVNIIKEQ